MNFVGGYDKNGNWEIQCGCGCDGAIDLTELPRDPYELGESGPGWVEGEAYCEACADENRAEADTRELDIPRHGAGYGG